MKTIFRYLNSLKFAVVIITLITILSAAGTFIPQKLEPIHYLRAYPQIGRVILELGFDDLYGSKIFLILVVLLGLSTLTCTAVRWASTDKRIRNAAKNITPEMVKKAALSYEAQERELAENFQEHFPEAKETEEGTFFLRKSGVHALIGALILHIGLLFLIVGGFIGLIFGAETFISGTEGEKVHTAGIQALRSGAKADKIARESRYIQLKNPKDSQLIQNKAEIEKLHKIYHQGITKPAFLVRFDKLWVEYNEKGKGVKSWNSAVTFIKNGEEAASATVRVNEPVTFEDYTFYQASWEPNYKSIKLRLEISPEASQEDLSKWQLNASDFPLIIDVKKGEYLDLKNCKYKIKLINFFPNMKFANGQPISSGNRLDNPSAQLEAVDLSAPGKYIGRAWAFKAEYGAEILKHASKMPLTFAFLSAETGNKSILTVSYDPGKPFVWLGCLMFAFGTILCFSGIYKEEWIFKDRKGSVVLAVLGNRSAEAYKQSFEDFKNEVLKKESLNDQSL